MPFLDETGVQNMTADIKTLADARYLKLGDNLTGDLTIEKDTQGFLNFKNTSLNMRAQAASLQETQSIGGLHWRDSNDELNGYLEIKRAYDTNNAYLQLNLRRYDSTGQQYTNHGFTMQINDNLEPIVTFMSSESRLAWVDGLNVVNKSGDTMTGNLTIERSTPMFTERGTIDTRIDATAPTSLTRVGGIHFDDSNVQASFYLESQYTTTKQLYSSFITRRYSADGSTYTNHGFYQRIENNGTLIVDFPSTASRKAWCVGLGVGDYVSKIVGSSGTQSIAHNTVVNLTNIALNPGIWVVTGRVTYATGGSTASGYRACFLGASASDYNYGIGQTPGATGGNTVVVATAILSLSAASTVYLNTRQYSGSAININKNATYIQAVRIRADV